MLKMQLCRVIVDNSCFRQVETAVVCCSLLSVSVAIDVLLCGVESARAGPVVVGNRIQPRGDKDGEAGTCFLWDGQLGLTKSLKSFIATVCPP